MVHTHDYYYVYSVPGLAPGGVANAVANTELQGPNVAAGVAEDAKARYDSLKLSALDASGAVVADKFILYRVMAASGSQLQPNVPAAERKDSYWECITVEDGAGHAVIAEANYTQTVGGSSVTEGLDYVDFMVTATEGDKFEGAHTVRVIYDNDGQASWNTSGKSRFRKVEVHHE